MRAAFEFRDASWFDGKVFELLRARDCALCVAERVDLATPRVAASFGYLRLRREDYTKRELEDWAKWIRQQPWDDVFIYFKHEEQGVGPSFAATMQKLAGAKPA